MPYIGQSLTEGTRREYTYVATASQTTFNAIYTVGAVDVYQNGVLLAPSDYTATTGTTVVFNTGAALNDEVTIHCHNTFSVADTVSASQGGTFNSDVTVVGDLTVDTNTLYVDSTNNRVGIGTSSPVSALHVNNSGTGSNDHAYAYFTTGDTGSTASDGLTVGYAAGNVAVIANREDTALSLATGNSNILFNTNATERMRIDSSGTLMVGTTDPAIYDDTSGNGFSVYSSGIGTFKHDAVNSVDPCLILNDTGVDSQVLQFRKDGTTVGSVSVTSSGTTYNTTSDRRLKTDIQPITNATGKLMAMKPVTHKWKADPEAGAVHGFIAQEMQEIVPEAVSGTPDGEEMMSMDYGRITPVLVAALQDAHKKIEALEERLAVLEAK
jgi:hypothetical protein